MQWNDRIGSRIKLRDLHFLLTAVQAGSMAQASGALGVSQPAVSKAIADLEHALGVRLLDRGPAGVAPTAFGQALVARSLAAFDELRQGVKEIEYLRDPQHGVLRIGSNEAATIGFVAAVVEHMRAHHPGIMIYVLPANSIAERHEELHSRHVELTIGRITTPAVDDTLDTEILFSERLYVVVGATSPLARRRKVTMADLTDEQWVLPPADSISGKLIADIFHANGLKIPEACVVTQSVQLHNRLLARGDFITIFPGSALRTHSKDLCVLPIRLPGDPQPVGIVTLKNRTLSPVAQLFLDCARRIARTEQQELPGAKGNVAPPRRAAGRARRKQSR